MKRALILQHVAFEDAGRVGAALTAAGFELETRRLDLGADVPAELGPGELLVVLGGPMGVEDLGKPSYSFLAREVALLERCLADERPVLGICLGAQLIAHAAGARVYPAERPSRTPSGARERVYEVGWAPVDFIDVERHAVLRGLAPREMMLHWHGDTFDLPPGALHLASTEVCPNQAFQLGRRAFALQFHCELTASSLARLLEADAAYAVRANGPNAVERIQADTRRYLVAQSAAGDRLLGNLVRSMTAS